MTAAATLAAADHVSGVLARATGGAFSAAVAAAAPACVLLGALPQLVRLLLPCFVQGLEAQPVGPCDLRPSMSPDTSVSAVCAVYIVFIGRLWRSRASKQKMLLRGFRRYGRRYALQLRTAPVEDTRGSDNPCGPPGRGGSK